MKHWRLHSLRYSLHQQTYPSFKSSFSPPHFLQIPKFIQARPAFRQPQQPYTIPNFNSTLSPTSFFRLLSKCCKNKSLRPGSQIHAHIAILGFLNDPKLCNQLVSFYSKIGAFSYAHKLLEGMPEPDVVSWTSLVSGYAHNGLGEEALLAFQQMHLLGIRCNEFTLASVLKACSIAKDFNAGKQIHTTVIVNGFDFDNFVGNSLVVMYAKCGQMLDSRRLFEETPSRDVVSWNVLFSCYVQSDLCQEAADLFQRMVLTETKPDGFSLSSIVSACTGLADGGQGRKLHGYLMKLGYDSNSYCMNALVDMYSKVGYLEDAIVVFEEIGQPDIVSWNAIISGCFLHEYHELGLQMLRQMRKSGLFPDMLTLSIALKGCAGLGLQQLGKQLHSCLIRLNKSLDLYAYIGLINMYSKGGLLRDAVIVFTLMPEKDLIAYNAMINGHTQNGEDVEALCLFNKMCQTGIGFDEMTLSAVLKSSSHLQAITVCEQVHGYYVKSGHISDACAANGLIDSYGECGCPETAARIFEGCPIRDVVSFTSMITAYAQYGLSEKALKLCQDMQHMGLKPDEFVYSALLNACAYSLAYEQGKQIHVQALKLGFMSDVFSGTSLVNMYAKCGSIDDAGRAFSEIPQKKNVTWTTLIGGLAQHGLGKEALQFFDEMLESGVSPSNVTMISVLDACNHAGLVTEAKKYFRSMKELYEIEPMQEHYACMIDLLSRAGQLNEAVELLRVMPFKASASVWGALLGASARHENIKLGAYVAEMLSTVEPDESVNRILLASLYASVGMWDDAANVRALMKDAKVYKDPGMSWG